MATVIWVRDLGGLSASAFAERLNLNLARTWNYLIYKFLRVILLPWRLHANKPSFKSRFEKYWFLRGFHRALLAIKTASGRTKLEVLTPQMLQVGIWENPSPGNEGINLIFHIHLEIRNDSAWVSRLLWREWHLINYGSVLKRETNKKKKKTKSILRKDKKDTSSCSKGTNQKKKKEHKQEHNTRHK